jgi:hypothetical protein
MSIAPKQIGWSQESNLLWEISKQLDRLNTQMCTGGCPTTTTTTTTVNLCRSYTITNLLSEDTTYSYINCEGVSVLDVPILDGANATFCALLDTVNFNSEIVDNGLCT